MIGRIKHVIDYSQLSSSAFADTIGISRSGLTHLLTGRNQPSLDVARKILAKFPDISTEWLIMGMGEMLRPDEQTVAASVNGETVVQSAAYPAENLKSDRQTNLFGEFENPANSESDMLDDVEFVAERENDVLEQEAKDTEVTTVEPAAVSRPMAAEPISEVSNPAQSNVRKSQEARQATPVRRDRRTTNTTSERKLQKIVFFYDDHSFEVFS